MLSLAGWIGTLSGCSVLLDLDGYSAKREVPDGGADGARRICTLGCDGSVPDLGGDTTCSVGEACAEGSNAAAGTSGVGPGSGAGSIVPGIAAGSEGVPGLGGTGGIAGAGPSDGSGGASAGSGGASAGAGGSAIAGAGSGGAGGAGGNDSSGGVGSGGAGSGNAGSGSAAPPSAVAQLLINGDFEAGVEPWASFTTGQDALIYDATQAGYEGVPAHGGQRLGWLGGVADETNRLSQTVNLPLQATRLTFAGALRVQIFEQHAIVDFLRVTVSVAGQRLPLLEFDNGDASDDWVDVRTTLDVSAFVGQTLTLDIESQIGIGPGTNFFLDDLALIPE